MKKRDILIEYGKKRRYYFRINRVGKKNILLQPFNILEENLGKYILLGRESYYIQHPRAEIEEGLGQKYSLITAK